MKDVIVSLSDQFKDKTKEEKSDLLEKEIDSFSSFMAQLPNEWFKGSLIKQERVLLKSYLVFKLSGKDST